MTHLQFWKEALLEAIFIEIEEGEVMVENFKRLENLVEILHKQGSKVPESVKNAYCHVAVDYTARCLAQKRDAKEAFIGAIKSIWLGRIMPLCDQVSCLVTRDLMDNCKRLWKAYIDEEPCESLMIESTRDRALVSLRKVVSELHPDPEYGYDGRDMYLAEVESGEEEGSVTGAREAEVNPNVSEAVDQGQESFSDMELERTTSEESEAESSPRQIKTVSPAAVEANLGASKIGLVNSLEEGEPETVNNEKVTEQNNDVANPSLTNSEPKLSLMTRRSAAHTNEGKVSIDGSDEEVTDDGERNDTSNRRRNVVSPSERNQNSESGISKRLSWSTAETLAEMEGHEKYGPNWKRSEEDYPVQSSGTNGDFEDELQVEMRGEGRRS